MKWRSLMPEGNWRYTIPWAHNKGVHKVDVFQRSLTSARPIYGQARIRHENTNALWITQTLYGLPKRFKDYLWTLQEQLWIITRHQSENVQNNSLSIKSIINIVQMSGMGIYFGFLWRTQSVKLQGRMGHLTSYILRVWSFLYASKTYWWFT